MWPAFLGHVLVRRGRGEPEGKRAQANRGRGDGVLLRKSQDEPPTPCDGGRSRRCNERPARRQLADLPLAKHYIPSVGEIPFVFYG